MPSIARARVYPCPALSSIECCGDWPRGLSLEESSEKKALNVPISGPVNVFTIRKLSFA